MRQFLVILMFFLLSNLALAEVKLYTEVEPSSGTLADDFVFRIVVESDSEVPYPLPVGGEDFELTFIGPQTNVEILNGKVSSKQIYIYRMSAKKTGLLDAPRAELEVAGKKLHSAAQRVEVKEASADIPRQGGPIFFRQSVEADRIYVGQQIPYHLDIYTQLGLLQPNVEELAFDGFWQEDLGKTQQFRKQFAGEQYQVVRVRKALFALRPGALSIPSRTLRALVHQRRQGKSGSPFNQLDPFSEEIFDRFFGNYNTKEIKLASNPLTLQIQELPPAPDNFPNWNLALPLVGQSDVELSIDKLSAEVGQSISLEIAIKSFANLNPVKDAGLLSNPRYKIYTESPEVQHFEKDGKLRTVKRFRVTLVPLIPGEIALGPLELGYFDPDTSQYQIARSTGVTIAVSGEALPVATQAVTVAPTQIALPAPTKPIYRDASGVEKLRSYVSTRLALLLCGIVLGLLALIWAAFALSLQGRAQRELSRNVQKSSSLRELYNTLREFLLKRANLDNSALRDELSIAISKRYPDGELRFELENILSLLEAQLYAQPAASEALILLELKARVLRIAKVL